MCGDVWWILIELVFSFPLTFEGIISLTMRRQFWLGKSSQYLSNLKMPVNADLFQWVWDGSKAAFLISIQVLWLLLAHGKPCAVFIGQLQGFLMLRAGIWTARVPHPLTLPFTCVAETLSGQTPRSPSFFLGRQLDTSQPPGQSAVCDHALWLCLLACVPLDSPAHKQLPPVTLTRSPPSTG